MAFIATKGLLDFLYPFKRYMDKCASQAKVQKLSMGGEGGGGGGGGEEAEGRRRRRRRRRRGCQ